jgi:hypothetical protein
MDLDQFQLQLSEILSQAQTLRDSTNLGFNDPNYGSLLPAKLYLMAAIGCMETAMKSEAELRSSQGGYIDLSGNKGDIDRHQEDSIDKDHRHEIWEAWVNDPYLGDAIATKA